MASRSRMTDVKDITSDKVKARTKTQSDIAKTLLNTANDLLIPKTPTDVALTLFPYGKAAKIVGKGIKAVRAIEGARSVAGITGKGAKSVTKIYRNAR